jgi:cell division protein FtsI (penicillin-binding protein 3)
MVTVSQNLNINSKLRGSNRYVSAKIKKNELHVKPLKKMDGYLPNVKGLTMKDALYLLEQNGLKVNVKGKGRVVKQSLRPGSKVIKGKQIEIILG